MNYVVESSLIFYWLYECLFNNRTVLYPSIKVNLMAILKYLSNQNKISDFLSRDKQLETAQGQRLFESFKIVVAKTPRV